MSEIATNSLQPRQPVAQQSVKMENPVQDKVSLSKESRAQEAKRLEAKEANVEAEQLVRERLEQVVEHMNDFIQSEQRDLRFSVDEASGETVISVLERVSGDLIRQIPNDQFLEMAKRARREGDISLIQING